MKNISSTGDGLSVIISCEETPLHNWMAFAAWYSIYKNLPDANVCLAVERGNTRNHLFSWCIRCKVKCLRYAKREMPVADVVLANKFLDVSNKIIVIPASAMAVRDYRPGDVVSVKADEAATFVHYQDGCGKFVAEDWIHRDGTPFKDALKRFWHETLSVNELKVLKLWEQCGSSYSATL